MAELLHHIVNCETGEVTVVPLTGEEIALREATAEPEPEPVDPLAELRVLRAEVERLKAGEA